LESGVRLPSNWARKSISVELRLLTVQSLPWSEIKKRAGFNTAWQWHRPDALDELKAAAIHKDIWREQGGFVDKGPFAQPDTDVMVQELSRNSETGEVTLRVTPRHGDTVYWDVGADASTASAKLDGTTLTVKDMRVSFLAVDSKGEHDAGVPREWNNQITLKYRIYDSGDDECVELRAAPPAPHPRAGDEAHLATLSRSRTLGMGAQPHAAQVRAHGFRDPAPGSGRG
jgi:hypothetical protein